MLDSVGQAFNTVDKTVLVKHIDNPTAFSVADSDLRAVLVKYRLAHAPEDFIIQEQSVIFPKWNSEFRSESKAQG